MLTITLMFLHVSWVVQGIYLVLYKCTSVDVAKKNSNRNK